MSIPRIITLDFLNSCKEYLDYNSETGLFTWKSNRGLLLCKGKIAGSLDYQGYIDIHFNSYHNRAHRLAYFFIYGLSDQHKQIDHIDGIRSNNSISNLRMCTSEENNRNSFVSTDSISGVKGVHWLKHDKKWRASIISDKKTYYLGQYKTMEEARKVVVAKRIELHGEFANNG